MSETTIDLTALGVIEIDPSDTKFDRYGASEHLHPGIVFEETHCARCGDLVGPHLEENPDTGGDRGAWTECWDTPAGIFCADCVDWVAHFDQPYCGEVVPSPSTPAQFVLTVLNDVGEGMQWGAQAQAEIEAEHHGETARFGDSWPGAQIQIAHGRHSLKQAEARYAKLQSLLRMCGQCKHRPAECYGMGPFSGDWADHYCIDCCARLGWIPSDVSKYPALAPAATINPPAGQ